MREFYEMTIAGVPCKLEKFPVSDNLEIAAFILFDNVEVTIAAAKELLKKAPEFDIIFTPEAKSIPLAYEMSRQSGIPYVVGRKAMKVYMGNAVSSEVKSITTQNMQNLFLGDTDAERLCGKRVLIVDDVISTGESLAACEKLVENAKGNIVAKVAVLAEGSAAKRDDIIYLESLPLFFK